MPLCNPHSPNKGDECADYERFSLNEHGALDERHARVWGCSVRLEVDP